MYFQRYLPNKDITNEAYCQIMNVEGFYPTNRNWFTWNPCVLQFLPSYKHLMILAACKVYVSFSWQTTDGRVPEFTFGVWFNCHNSNI